jgi:hypothetical protein
MTYQATNESGDHRERMIRVEERLKHMDESMGRSLRDLKDAITDLASGSKVELAETRSRLTMLEKRVDKIYWLWSAAIFIGTPAMTVITKIMLKQFGF